MQQITPQLVTIPMPMTDRIDVYSGVARRSGMLWATLHEPDPASSTVFLVVHPTSNFLGHYLLPILASRGVAAMGFTTRYIGNDTALIMENCVLDIGAAVRYLRERGFETIVLVGNSGGGGLVALYQSQAETPSITQTPAGDPPDLTKAGLEPADAIIAFMAHPGRAITFTNWLDPAITDESLPFARAPRLDMFRKENGPPYAPAFLEAYRDAQVDRNIRITTWVQDQLESLMRQTDGKVDDLPFVVHGTCADPRFLDLGIEPTDREPGTLWGEPFLANYMPASLGHATSLRSWLSQWGIQTSNCHGPKHLARVAVPVLVTYGTADTSCFPSDAAQLYDSVLHDQKRLVAIQGANHYFMGQDQLLQEAADELVNWVVNDCERH